VGQNFQPISKEAGSRRQHWPSHAVAVRRGRGHFVISSLLGALKGHPAVMRSQLYARAWGYYLRKSNSWLFRRPFAINSNVPLISFTFDDFPRSALLTGGAILNRFGVAGTYYAAFGLMGQDSPVGPIFVPEDLEILTGQGHELGCHTFGHFNAATTSPDVFERSILENQQALNHYVPGTSFRTFAYPLYPPRPENKRRTGRHFLGCRCGNQNINERVADLNYLSAFFIEKSRNDPAAIENIIERNRVSNGWLIFATHDVAEKPSPWGCSPELFEHVVAQAVNSGARILPVVQALHELVPQSYGGAPGIGADAV
jgi:peptidoglycan/xylan/chitin deacetylase (PgdA/CDA1 family)